MNSSKSSGSRCCSLFGLLALLPATLTAATEIHIAPAGNDANPGTAAQPVSTPQGAQVRVRSLIQGGLGDSVEVIFAAGTYVMAAPLELRPEDSGTAAFPISWKAAPGAEVTLSGGKRITSTWTKGAGGIWHTDLTGIGLAAGQWNFRQLFVDGSRAVRARYPNVTEASPFLYATGAIGNPKGAFDHLVITPSLIKPSWGAAADAQINVVPQSRFFNQWNTVTAVDPTSGRIDIADSERHRLIDNGSWFWIEGVQEELDQPGEWFLDPKVGRLFYMPPVGIDPNTRNIIAPFLNRLVDVKGDVNAGTHVSHLNFDGLKFRYTSNTLGEAAAKVAPILNRITNNTVEHCGKIRYYGGGVHLDSRPFSMTMSPGNYIAHNLFNDLSRNGVFAFRNQGGNVVEYNHIHNAMQTTIDGGCIHFATGIVNLFEFEFLTGTAAESSQATYRLPITEDGNYQISLLYKPGTDRASNVPVTIDHADGIAKVAWNMQKGSKFGFAVPVGIHRFVAAETNTVTLSTAGTDGKVIADSVAFVKVPDHAAGDRKGKKL